ncbi:hypothetical protein [Bradyrhizobium elkanii]|uniref:hypothetical protein n=1 Tax=Bradyrhizobium elkanii TaxID=29448 RepID=UPI001BAA028E|nr:hypothetical protein [Bradyrhizobium elkanii]MBR1164602.1 hypothetical protein [Bradyrhizobium elkanii]
MRRWAILSLTTVLTGCGTYLPELTSRQALPLEVLIANIDCEFQQAVWAQKYVKGRTFLAGWQGQYGVTLKSNETGSAKALSNTFPFLPAKNLAINASLGAAATTTANRTAVMKFSLAFDSVKREPLCADIRHGLHHPFLTGKIGFAEWMDRAFDAAQYGGEIQNHEPQRISSLGHTFEFIVDLNASAGAGFVIGPAPTIGINPSISGERVDDGVVDVVIAKPAVDPLPGLIVGLTKAERELIAELRKLIATKEQNIANRTTKLNAPANKELIAKVPNFDRMSIQSILPTDPGQQRELSLNSEQLEQLRTLKTLQEENQSDEKAIKDAQKKIDETKPQPTLVVRPRVLPPDRNPEIIATSQQLTLERLNNVLRVSP